MLQQSKDIAVNKYYICYALNCIFLTVAEIGYVVVCCGGVGC